MRRERFGTMPDGSAVDRLVIGSAPGPVVHLLTLGATVHRVQVTGGDGVRRDMALGHADPAAYLASTAYVGGTIGRYANRIADGRFDLDGETVQLGAHDRGHHLHGGPDGWDRRLWTVEEHTSDEVILGLHSPDGDQGFPTALSVRARYRVDADTLHAELSAVADPRATRPTVVNLTSHLYLNLDGDGCGTIDDHLLQVGADDYTPIDPTGIPYGGHAPVAGTAFDARDLRRIGEMVRRGDEQVVAACGIDHNYVVAGEGIRVAAVLESPRTQTRMTLRSDQPGLQVYTGNSLDGSRRDRLGGLYRQGDGIALEPQLFPDTPHHPEWPSARLEPGATYRSTMSWTFTSTRR